MICPDCGAENRDDVKTCAHCGKPIEWWRIRVKGRVGSLSPHVLTQLDAIPRTHMGKTPAEAILEDGRCLPCLLLLEVTEQTKDEFFMPLEMLLRDSYEFDEKTRRRVVQPETISSIVESRYRTPIALERKMYGYEFHEIGMGADFWCRLIIDDGSEYIMRRPDWDREFIVLPGDTPNTRISDVLPVRGDMAWWRLYEAGMEMYGPGVKYCLFKR